MVRRCSSVLLLLSAAGIACAQWTALPNDPAVWAYGDTMITPTDTQILNVYRTFNIFANGKFNILGGRSGKDYKENMSEIDRTWYTTNRHSRLSLYNPAFNTWETAGVQSLLVWTGDTSYWDDDSFITLDDLTSIIFPGDFVKLVNATSTQGCYGKIESVDWPGDGLCYVKFIRRPYANGECTNWVGGIGDRIFVVTVSGLCGINTYQQDPDPRIPPFFVDGYQSYTNQVAAYDKNNDGTKELYLFNGYPNWIPYNVDIYDPVTDGWRVGGGNMDDLGIPNIDVQPPGGVQDGKYFYWITQQGGDAPTWFKIFRYDMENEVWEDFGDISNPGHATRGMPFMKNVEIIGTKMYVFWGWQNLGSDPPEWGPTTLVVDLPTKTWVKRTPPPIAANQGSTIKYGTKILYFGGRREGGAGSAIDDIQIYDTVADTWTISTVKCPYKASTPAVGLGPDGTVYYAVGLDQAVVWRNDAYKTHISQIIPSAVSVSGKLGLEFHVNPALVTGTLQVYSPFGGGLLKTKPLALDLMGNFNVTLGVGPGTYDLRFGAPNYLWKRLSNVNLSAGGNAVGTVNLICGDGNANNQIELGDLNMVLINFGGTGAGDFNGDGATGLGDLNIVLVNFGKSGDN